MCGINAIFRFSKLTKNDVEKISRMNKQMEYRGPDDNGIWNDDTCAMAHTRLSIIGGENGHQPLFNQDKSLVLICNGEIYNYRELRKEVAAKGYECKTESDCEVILYLYELYGTKCLDYLRGMFAFCLYDKRNKKMFVARDRIGERTLYYAQVPCGVVVSTELKSILKEYIPNPQINVSRLMEPLRYIAPLDMENTWVNQIKRLLPGHYMEIDSNGIHITRYWEHRRYPSMVCSREEALEQTLALMQESVDLTMHSDVPVAVMLSGGIDSSAVAALAKRAGRDVHTITVGFGGEVEYDERSIARRLAEEKGFDYNEIVLNPEDYEEAFEELSHYIDEPVTDSAAIAQWVLYKKIREIGYKVVLSGMGGDELFFNYAGLNMQAKARKLHHQFEQICPIDSFEKKKQWYRIMRAHWKALIMPQAWHMTNESAYIPWYNDSFKRFIKDATLTLDGKSYSLIDYAPHQRYPECEIGRELDQAYDDALDRIMVGAYLYLGDRMCMGHGLEVRCPLIDHKLVEYALRLPQEMVGLNKSFMKEALKDILPDYILNGKKRGFTPTTNYPQMVADKHNYQYIHTSAPFYPAAVADAMLTNLLSK